MKTLGTYTYKHPTYVGGLRTWPVYTMRVEIIGERANKWRIKYLGFHASGEGPGGLHNVRKDKVRLDIDNGSTIEFKGIGAVVNDAIKNPPPMPATPPINTQQDAIDALGRIYRTPYKDND